MRAECPDNIVLIGMPGAGKSTTGVLLAKRLGYRFLDTDLLIQAEARARLQEIIVHEGLAAFRQREERVVRALDLHRTVVATGGSVIYSDQAMRHLRQLGRLVFLELPLADLEPRIRDMDSRGLVIDPGETFAQLFQHRQPLYRRHAELTIPCAGRTAEEIAASIEAAACPAAQAGESSPPLHGTAG